MLLYPTLNKFFIISFIIIIYIIVIIINEGLRDRMGGGKGIL